MTASRFRFLEEDFPDLYDTCVRAEQAAEYDVAVLQIGRAMETILKGLGANNQDLFRGINELEGRAIISREKSRLFHALRRIVSPVGGGSTEPDGGEIQSCLDQLFILTVVYGATREKTYGLELFELDDVPTVRKYLAKDGMLPAETVEAAEIDAWSIEPLRLEAPVSEAAQQELYAFACDVFETEEEFEQRIAAMDPVYIGCALLDGRKKDEYTGVTFLIHHIDHNEDIKISSIDAFYTKEPIADEVIDGELVAKLKIHEDKVCCDYSQVYLQHENELIAVRAVCWDNFFYENKEAYEERISSLPLLPFGIGMPVRSDYDLTTEMLPVVINPFRYAGKVFKDLLSADKRVKLHCNRDLAKRLCDGQAPLLLFLRLHTVEAVAKSVFWRSDVGDIAEREYRDVLDWYQKGADKGYGPAQNNLGNRYYNGNGVDQDYGKAVEWYRKAAEQGHAYAQNHLGDCYYYGNGVDEDNQKAVEWFQKSAEQGWMVAQRNLGDGYYYGWAGDKDYQKAVVWYQKAAEQGSAWAQNNLGRCYYEGQGVEKDYRKAVEWYQKAAEQGLADAQNRLGNRYYNGEGVDRDYRKAAAWFQKGAEQGHAWAQFNLGECYRYGNGVERDREKAIEWYRKAAEQGKDNERLQNRVIEELAEI